MAEERIYTIPLTKVTRRVPSYKKTKRAVSEVKKFVEKHMKTENAKLSVELNNLLHKDGRKHPPAKIKVRIIKDTKKVKKEDVEYVIAYSFNYKIPKEEEKKKDSKKKEVKHEVKKETTKEIKEQPKVEDKKEELKSEEPKVEVKKKAVKKKVAKKEVVKTEDNSN